MQLVECAVIDEVEEAGGGVWLHVSLSRSLAVGQEIFTLAPDGSFIVNEILSDDEPITEAGGGTAVSLFLQASPDHFRENMELYIRD